MKGETLKFPYQVQRTGKISFLSTTDTFHQAKTEVKEKKLCTRITIIPFSSRLLLYFMAHLFLNVSKINRKEKQKENGKESEREGEREKGI